MTAENETLTAQLAEVSRSVPVTVPAAAGGQGSAPAPATDHQLEMAVKVRRLRQEVVGTGQCEQWEGCFLLQARNEQSDLSC